LIQDAVIAQRFYDQFNANAIQIAAGKPNQWF
jgi:hypothetical protein